MAPNRLKTFNSTHPPTPSQATPRPPKPPMASAMAVSHLPKHTPDLQQAGREDMEVDLAVPDHLRMEVYLVGWESREG